MLISTLQLVVDLGMRRLMTENSRSKPSAIVMSENINKLVDFSSPEVLSDVVASVMNGCHEQTTLLPPRSRQVKEQKEIYLYIYVPEPPFSHRPRSIYAS